MQVVSALLLAIVAAALSFNVVDNSYFREAIELSVEHGYQRGFADANTLQAILNAANTKEAGHDEGPEEQDAEDER